MPRGRPRLQDASDSYPDVSPLYAALWRLYGSPTLTPGWVESCCKPVGAEVSEGIATSVEAPVAARESVLGAAEDPSSPILTDRKKAYADGPVADRRRREAIGQSAYPH